MAERRSFRTLLADAVIGDPLLNDLKKIGDLLEQMVDLKRLALGLPPMAGGKLALELAAGEGRDVAMPPAAITTDTQVVEALRRFGADQGFSTSNDLEEDPYGFAQRHGWVTAEGEIMVDLSPYTQDQEL
jgi:hypothetical protein